MSIVKQALVTADEPLITLLHPGQGVKLAGIRSEVQAFVDTLSPSPEFTYALGNAMGYSEYYGPNSNTDWYGYNPYLDFNGLLHAWPDIGQDIVADQMKGKGWHYGYPCFYGAAVFAHHKNHSAEQLGFGDVIFASANPQMKRIELVMRISNAEAEKKGNGSILRRLDSGERCDLSMGCRVPFDNCSICTDWAAMKEAWKTFDPKLHAHPGIAILAYHRKVRPIRGLAVTKADYCECMTKRRGQVLPDGRKVFVFNDFAKFFDISFVWVGADRTARVMWFMGSSRPEPAPAPARQSTPFGKTAMEKEIPDGLAHAVAIDARCGAPISSEFLEPLTQLHGAQSVLSTLAGLGILPSPREFQTIVLSGFEDGPAIRQVLDKNNTVFETDQPGLDPTNAARASAFSDDLAKTLVSLMRGRSFFAPYLNPRLLSPQPKVAGLQPLPMRDELLDKIAAQYTAYRISVLEEAPYLFPKVASVLDPEWFLRKEAGVGGLAALLLGLGPVIHLLSSHLSEKQEAGSSLNPMTKLVAENPTFTTLATVGGILRAAMEIERAGGVLSAAKKVVSALI